MAEHDLQPLRMVAGYIGHVGGHRLRLARGQRLTTDTATAERLVAAGVAVAVERHDQRSEPQRPEPTPWPLDHDRPAP